MAKIGRPADSEAARWLKGATNKRPAAASPASIKANQRPKRPPKPPDNLGEHGRRMWRFLWRELTDADLLASSDLVALEMVASTYEIWRLASEAVNEHGVLMPDGRGALRKNPSLQVMRDADTSLNRWFKAFGLAPGYAQAMGLIDDD